jgi:hypothetical protein
MDRCESGDDAKKKYYFFELMFLEKERRKGKDIERKGSLI